MNGAWEERNLRRPDELSRVPVIIAGPVALRYLRGGERQGEVLASFQHSAYVRLEQDDVICLCSAALRAGPLNVTVEAPEAFFARLRQGAPVWTCADCLHVDALYRFEFGSVAEWHPPRLSDRASWCAVKDGFALLARRLQDHRLSEGLGPLLPQLCSDWKNLRVPGGGGELGVLDLAVPALGDLLAWLSRAAATGDGPPPPVAGLIGLGPGLTPSGDDVLCGILVGLHATGRIELAGRLAEAAMREAAMREAAEGTGIISRAHLACACLGLGSEALHEALNALLACNAPALDRALDALARTGHSSGWDGLAGLVACLAVIPLIPADFIEV